MPDETTSNTAPVDATILQTPETPILVVNEPSEPIQVEIPTEVAPTPEPITEPATAQMGGNEPLAEPMQVEVEAIPPTETTQAEATPVAQVETPASAPADIRAPVVVPVVAQTFTKSMRELFTKALNARQNKKKKKLDRILSLFAKQTMVTNNEVEKLLHVSDSTATRYLATLTKEEKIKQNTKKGQATSYSKI